MLPILRETCDCIENYSDGATANNTTCFNFFLSHFVWYCSLLFCHYYYQCSIKRNIKEHRGYVAVKSKQWKHDKLMSQGRNIDNKMRKKSTMFSVKLSINDFRVWMTYIFAKIFQI